MKLYLTLYREPGRVYTKFRYVDEDFKTRFTAMLKFMSEKVIVEKPINIVRFLADILEEKVEVRECLETVIQRGYFCNYI